MIYMRNITITTAKSATYLENVGETLADDPTGDRLDAFLCAVQAAWAWTHRASGYGAPPDLDPLEGWIADPVVRNSCKAAL